MSILVTLEGMPEWGWRFACMFGAACSFFGWSVRMRISESPEFKKLKKQGNIIDSSPILEVFRSQKLAVSTTLIIGALDGILSYFIFVFLALYLEVSHGFSHQVASVFGIMAVFGFTFFSPLMGWVLDQTSRTGYFKFCMLILAVCAFPMFSLLGSQSLYSLIIVVVLFSIMAAAVAGAQHAYVQKLFPVKDRYSGIAFSFSVGMSIGGFSPFIFGTFMNKPNGLYYMGFYFFIWALVGVYTVLKMNKRLRNKRL
jgi:MHS family proline/betaine transporter-like MFS transporter